MRILGRPLAIGHYNHEITATGCTRYDIVVLSQVVQDHMVRPASACGPHFELSKRVGPAHIAVWFDGGRYLQCAGILGKLTQCLHWSD